ncbi:hypothetical protein Ancab_026842 [Ancistrocladus abbreviatus]
MMLEMGLQDLAAEISCLRQGYTKLISSRNNGDQTARPRGRWTKRIKRRIRGVKQLRQRKVNWRAFSLAMLPRRIGRMCAQIAKRLMSLEGALPNLIFATNWGLPVLSAASSVNCRKTAVISYHGSLIFV